MQCNIDTAREILQSQIGWMTILFSVSVLKGVISLIIE